VTIGYTKNILTEIEHKSSKIDWKGLKEVELEIELNPLKNNYELLRNIKKMSNSKKLFNAQVSKMYKNFSNYQKINLNNYFKSYIFTTNFRLEFFQSLCSRLNLISLVIMIYLRWYNFLCILTSDFQSYEF